ncbi:gag protease polyprotein [Cucumis melo var. makuwa]|uniref:Gag protease polyprotein n=1 Tax=Cucumis melo var. makuwa TaxID=1194695 RepID=A0A5D3BQG8_CUCMM|nr:gag protease polyprotein [Cucumis melo var. makuwa]TYK01414.1 gag protease polyprotein [Cucumis melo var. makuwa]
MKKIGQLVFTRIQEVSGFSCISECNGGVGISIWESDLHVFSAPPIPFLLHQRLPHARPPPPSPNLLSSTRAGRHPFSPSPSLCGGTVSVSVIGNLTTPVFVYCGPSISEHPLGLTHPDAVVRPSSHRVCRRPVALRRVEAEPVVGLLQVAKRSYRRTPKTVARGCIGSRDLTLKFLGPTASSFGNSSLYSGGSVERGLDRGHNQVSGKSFPTTRPPIEAENVVIHKGLHVSNVTASCSLCAIGCKELFTEKHRCPDVRTVSPILIDKLTGSRDITMCTLRIGVSFGITRLICAYVGSTRLICASLGITRLIGVSLRISRLIRASFGITRLMCAFYGTTRLLCKGTARGRPTRGRKDAEMPPRRGARRGGRGGRGRGVGRVQPEVQPVAQATDPTAPVTHGDLAAMEQRLRDLIMQMRE